MAGQALQEIGAVSKQLATLIASISHSTTSQAEAAIQVAARMKDILSITNLTADGTKKTAASTQQLATLAQDLKSSVAGFKLA
jgi:twitching motility protein PilJ